MISEIVQKEKERQLELAELKIKSSLSGDWEQHKQFLINLKKDREGDLRKWKLVLETLDKTFAGEMVNIATCELIDGIGRKIDQLKEDIKELEVLIGRYE